MGESWYKDGQKGKITKSLDVTSRHVWVWELDPKKSIIGDKNKFLCDEMSEICTADFMDRNENKWLVSSDTERHLLKSVTKKKMIYLQVFGDIKRKKDKCLEKEIIQGTTRVPAQGAERKRSGWAISDTGGRWKNCWARLRTDNERRLLYMMRSTLELRMIKNRTER